MPIGDISKEGHPFSPKHPEDLFKGNIGKNIKQMVVELMKQSLKESLVDMEIAIERSFEAFRMMDSFFDHVQRQKTQTLLEQKYGPVLSSNFGLAANTLIAFFHRLEEMMSSSELAKNAFDTEQITQALESPVFTKYAQDSEMPYPSELELNSHSAIEGIIRSVLFVCNIASFSTLVFLAAGLVHSKEELSTNQISQMEQLLRDWTLDFLIQVSESLHSELDVRGPLNISIPFHEDDAELAEMGLGDYLERLE